MQVENKLAALEETAYIDCLWLWHALAALFNAVPLLSD